MKFYVTAEEKELMEQKMAQLQIKRIGAYMRKMALDGYIIYLGTRDISVGQNRKCILFIEYYSFYKKSAALENKNGTKAQIYFSDLKLSLSQRYGFVKSLQI